jgi:membrane protein implicated in regulation of membrane protease activity
MWWLWIVIAVAAAIGEMMTTGLFLAAVAVAALIVAVLAVFVPAVVQFVAFIGLSLAGIAVFRPIVVRALGMEASREMTGPVSHSHLVGKRATAVRQIDSTEGQIRIGEGEFWSARTYDPDEVIPAGQTVEILLVDGLTALVTPAHTPIASSAHALPQEERT